MKSAGERLFGQIVEKVRALMGETGNNRALRLSDMKDAGVIGQALVALRKLIGAGGGGTGPATTDDLPEGATNRYFTDARADARIAAQKGVALGIATLGADAKILSAQLPALAITETYVVASQAAQLALPAQEGDVAIRTDLSQNFIHNAGTTGTMSDWNELLTPGAPVQSVNGLIGNVTLTAANVGAATAAQGAKADSAVQPGALGTAAAKDIEFFATAAQGDKADSALQDAPSDGKLRGRKDGAWAEVPFAPALKFPFYNAAGVYTPIPLTSANELRFFLANGTQVNIPVVTA